MIKMFTRRLKGFFFFFFFTFTPPYFLRAPGDSNSRKYELFSISLEGPSYLESTVPTVPFTAGDIYELAI